jgi:ribosomal protein uS19
MGLIKKLRIAKKEAPPNEKPAVVKTHLRDMIIVPEMIGSVVGIYNGKVCYLFPPQLRLIAAQVFNSVEIKPEMTGHYLGEFSISYKPVKHGRPGIGATHCKCTLLFGGYHLHTYADSISFVCDLCETFFLLTDTLLKYSSQVSMRDVYVSSVGSLMRYAGLYEFLRPKYTDCFTHKLAIFAALFTERTVCSRLKEDLA